MVDGGDPDETARGAGAAFEVIAAEIERLGPIPFDRFLELALYAADAGFYETGGAAGRAHGDFLTSPEVGSLFGAVVARALDAWWDELGRPDPYVVVDAGAGPGTLAVTVRAAVPRCAPALRYLLVECSAAQRARHADHLPLSPPEAVEAVDGPVFVSLGELPVGPITGVVLGNELLDNLPFRLLERIDATTGAQGTAPSAGAERGWVDIHVGLAPDGDRLVEVPVPAAPDDAAWADRLVPDAPAGARFPIQRGAHDWLVGALALVDRGRIVVVDYADTTPGMVGRGTDWLRTYRGHERGGGPLDTPGDQDVTAEVAIDQLALVRAPDHDRVQADFLRAHGIDDLVEEGRRVWHERAHLGDLEALKARSRVTEADALLDPTGLGAFRVLEWVIE